jgi:hypothetical protein
MHEEIKKRIHHSEQILFCVFSSVAKKNHTRIIIYKAIILPMAFYGCENWSLTLREEHGLRVSENIRAKE